MDLSKDRKNLRNQAGSALPSYFGTGHLTVLPTPSRKTDLISVPPVWGGRGKENG